MLDRKVSAELTWRQGLFNTIESDTETADADKIVWLEPVEDDRRRSTLWARIISGDLPGRF